MNRRQKLVQQQFLNNEEAVIGRLRSVYGQSLSDISEKVKNLTFTIGELQEEYDWMDDSDPKKAQLKSKIQSKIYQRNYQEQLESQVDGILKKMKASQYTSVSAYLDECYTDGFIGSLFDLHGQGIPLITPIDQSAMVRAVQLDSKISKGLYSRLGEDVDLLKKRITSEVSRGISTGMSYDQVARGLAGYTRIGYNNAIRIARTEGHRIQTTAAMDAMESAKEKGADILKQWDATLDSATRESHVAVDGEVRELDKPFSNGLMYPGDPSGGASEVINCRCALLQRARWALEDDDKSFTKFNNFTGQLEEFDSPQTYDEFKKAYFSNENRAYMDYVQEMEEKYGTKDFRIVLDKMSDNEYNYYAKLLKNNPVYADEVKIIEERPDFHDLTLDEYRRIVHPISKEERRIVYGSGHFSGYINSCNARKMNDIIRTGGTLSAEYQEIADTLQSIIDRNTLPNDIVVTRYVSTDALEAITGIRMPMATLSMSSEEYFAKVAEIPSLIPSGHIYTEKAFLSTSGVFTKNVMQSKGIVLNIKAPKGTNCYVTTNYKESEIIFGQGTKLKILGATIEDSGTADCKVVLDCIIVR